MAKFGVACGVPLPECNGSTKTLSKGIEYKVKVHSNSLEAFKCQEKYLLKQGFKKVGNREYLDPLSGYIRVLTKKSRYGGKLRSGKGGEGNTGSRGMPKGRFTGGMIISK